MVNAWTFIHEVVSSIPVGINVILVQRKYTCFSLESLVKKKKFYNIPPFPREEAGLYIYEQSKWDSRRGLKRTWVNSRPDATEAGPSTKSKHSSAEKGKSL